MSFPGLWVKVLCQRSVPATLDLYRPDAVLVPTYSDRVLQGHRQLGAYFRAFLAKDGLCGRVDGVVEQELSPRLKASSGVYTFAWRERGQPKSVVARFTFVLAAEDIPTGRVWTADKRWRIVTHHSSEMPDV